MNRLGTLLALLFLLGTALPVANAQTRSGAQEFTATDGEGDVRPVLGNTVPAGVPLDWLDLKSVRIYDEDMEGLRVELGVKNLKRPPNLLMFFGPGSFTLRFKLEGSAHFYLVTWVPESNSLENQTPAYRLSFCVRTSEGGGQGFGGCNPRQRAFGGVDYAQNRLYAYLPKLSLMGKDPVDSRNNQDLGIQVPKGTKITGIWARSSQGFGEDRLPDTGDVGPYELQYPAANDRIRIKLTPKAENQTNEPCEYYCPPSQDNQNQDFPKVSVEPGLTTLVRLDVVNLNGAKRRINLTARLESKSDEKKWEVRIAPGVQIPGSETRTVNLIVNATPDVFHRESTLVRIVGTSYLFKDEIGALTLRLVASVPPSLNTNTLYFHAKKYSGDTGLISSCTIPIFGSWGCQPTRWLNTLETDATADLDAEGDGTGSIRLFFGGGDVRYVYNLDAALTRDIVLDPKQPIAAIIQVKTAVALEGSITFHLSSGGKTVARTESSFSVPQNGGPVTLNFLPRVDGTRIRAGDKIQADFTIGYENLGSNAGSIVSPPYFLPKGSKLTLPITTDPNSTQRPPVPMGDAFLSLNRINKEDNEFAYPGRARVFEFTVVNEGGLEDIARLVAEPVSGTCEIEIRPATAFKLSAGDSAKFGVLLRPAPEAKEGQQCHVQVNATSSVDPSFTVSQRVYIVVATSIDDLPDDSKTYMADKDSQAKAAAATPQGKSPGPGAVLALLGLAALVGLRRRRA